MGLDWNPLARPNPGQEDEFADVVRRIGAAAQEDRAPLIERFRALSKPPFELLGAPRVGIDPAADEWLKSRLRDPSKLDEARAAMRGYCVLDLLPECDGFPVYSNYGAYEGIDRFSFRAQFLEDVADVLGDELMKRAYQTMLAEDLARYADALFEKARAFAREHGVEPVEQLRSVEYREGSPETRAHIMFAAAKWCRYWSSRGHGLEPWF